jgi:hypothetical protein
MSDVVGGMQAPQRHQVTAVSTHDRGRDGLGTASLVLGIAGFLPIPGLAASVLAVILGSLSGTPAADGRRRRSSAAVTGIVLGCVSIALFITICIVYFGILGYPLPQIHRYQPPAISGCACDGLIH